MVARVDPDDGERMVKPMLRTIGIAVAALTVLALITIGVRTFGVSVDDALGDDIEEAATRADGGVINLADVTDFEWSRVCLFPPGTPADLVERTYGYGWTHALRDDAVTVVFTRGGEIVRQTHLSPTLAEMPPQSGSCMPPSSAEVRFRSP